MQRSRGGGKRIKEERYAKKGISYQRNSHDEARQRESEAKLTAKLEAAQQVLDQLTKGTPKPAILEDIARVRKQLFASIDHRPVGKDRERLLNALADLILQAEKGCPAQSEVSCKGDNACTWEARGLLRGGHCRGRYTQRFAIGTPGQNQQRLAALADRKKVLVAASAIRPLNPDEEEELAVLIHIQTNIHETAVTLKKHLNHRDMLLNEITKEQEELRNTKVNTPEHEYHQQRLDALKDELRQLQAETTKFFRTISPIVLSSLLYTGAALAVMGGIHAILPGLHENLIKPIENSVWWTSVADIADSAAKITTSLSPGFGTAANVAIEGGKKVASWFR